MINIGSITRAKTTINTLHTIIQAISKATETIVTINPKKASNNSFISFGKNLLFKNVIINITP